MGGTFEGSLNQSLTESNVIRNYQYQMTISELLKKMWLLLEFSMDYMSIFIITDLHFEWE